LGASAVCDWAAYVAGSESHVFGACTRPWQALSLQSTCWRCVRPRLRLAWAGPATVARPVGGRGGMAAGDSRLVPRPGQQPQRERLRRAMGQVGPRRPAACGGEGQGCGRGGRGGPGAAQAAAGRGWGCRRRRRGRDGRGACRAERRAGAGAGAAVAGAQLRAALLWAGHKRPYLRSATKRQTAGCFPAGCDICAPR